MTTIASLYEQANTIANAHNPSVLLLAFAKLDRQQALGEFHADSARKILGSRTLWDYCACKFCRALREYISLKIELTRIRRKLAYSDACEVGDHSPLMLREWSVVHRISELRKTMETSEEHLKNVLFAPENINILQPF